MSSTSSSSSTSNISNASKSSSELETSFNELIKSVHEKLTEEFGNLDHDDFDFTVPPVVNKISNPSRLPLNQIHFETYETKQIKELPDDLTADDIDVLDVTKYFRRESVVVPALSKVFVSEKKQYHPYQPFYFAFNDNANDFYVPNNLLFNKEIEDLLNLNYHRFWCHILYATKLTNNILDFIQKPVFWYEFNYIDGNEFQLYLRIYMNVYKILQRLLEFHHSEEEHMAEETVVQYLEETKFLHLNTLINVAILYGSRDTKMVSKLFAFRTSPKRLQRFKGQVQKVLKGTLLAMEMVGGYICGFEEGAKITPIPIEPKPINFDPCWYNDAITYILRTIIATQTLFLCNKESVDVAISMGLPYRMTYFYDRVFPEFHSIINREWNVSENEILREHILHHLVTCRGKWIQTFDNIVTSIIDKILLHVGDSSVQTQHVEQYFQLITNAMEDEMFFADYHAEYNVNQQIDNIRELHPEIDQMRTDFIRNCVKNSSSNFKMKRDIEVQTILTTISTLKLDSCQFLDPDIVLAEKLDYTDSFVTANENCDAGEEDDCLPQDVIDEAMKAIDAIPPEVLRMLRNDNNDVMFPRPSTSKSVRINTDTSIPSEYTCDEKVEEAINVVANTLPHLGDGFILKCLQYYNYNPTEVISAILDENLAPHLAELPFDEIRIPPEPEPPQPIQKHIGKKPFEYDDATAFLDDKSALTKQVRESITNYLYDDDYDDSADNPIYAKDYSLLGRDASEIIESVDDDKLVSEPESTSEEEYDDEGKPVDSNKRDAFCEDPALIRERREQQMRNQHRGKQDVRGKPKGQGQDKNVRINRDKKNVQKSSRANHNRKSGAQWKRSRTMLPS